MKVKLFGDKAREYKRLWDQAGHLPQITSAKYKSVEGRSVITLELETARCGMGECIVRKYKEAGFVVRKKKGTPNYTLVHKDGYKASVLVNKRGEVEEVRPYIP